MKSVRKQRIETALLQNRVYGQTLMKTLSSIVNVINLLNYDQSYY